MKQVWAVRVYSDGVFDGYLADGGEEAPKVARNTGGALVLEGEEGAREARRLAAQVHDDWPGFRGYAFSLQV